MALNIQFITYEELKTFLVLENDENKNLYTQDINVASLKILALCNNGNLLNDFNNNLISDEDLFHIKQASLILCKWGIENGNFKTAQSLSASLGAFNISQGSQGDNMIPDEVIEHLGHTKYYNEISFLSNEPETNLNAITITTDDIDRGLSLLPKGNTLTTILNGMYLSQEATHLLVLQNEKKTQHLDIDGNVLGNFDPTLDRPGSMKMIFENGGKSLPDILDKKLDYSTDDTFIIYSQDKKTPTIGSYILFGTDRLNYVINNRTVIALRETDINIAANIEMNANKITNLAPALSGTSAVNLDQLNDVEDRVKIAINLNDSLSNRDLAMLNKVSNNGSNLKEGKSLLFQSYQYATLPIKSVIIGSTPTPIPLPKGTDQWVDQYLFTPTAIATYLFKHLFYYILNPFTDTNKQKYRIIARVRGLDGTDYALPYDFDLSKIKSADIQKKTFPNFLKLFADLNPANAPYTYNMTIQGLDGSEGALLIETESSGSFDVAIPGASHFEIIEMIPKTDKLVLDNNIHFNDPNIYTSLGYVMPDTPGGGKDDTLPPLLEYAILDIPYIKIIKKVFEVGENATGEITKTVANFGKSLTLASTAPINNVGSNPKSDTSAATIGDVKALIHTENPLIDKNLLKNGTSKSVSIPFVINPNGTVNDLELPLETPDVEYIAGKTYADVNKIRVLYNVKWNTGAAKSINANYNIIFNKEDNGDWLPTTPEIIISLPPITGFDDPERTLIPQALIKTSAGHPYKFDISFKDGTNASDYAGQKLFLEVEQIWYNELETSGGSVPPTPLLTYKNQNYQNIISRITPTPDDGYERTVKNWQTKPISTKTMFNIQSNGGLVINEDYRKEIADSGIDRIIRADFTADGFINSDGDYYAKFDVSGAFDFNNNRFLLYSKNKTTTAGYLSRNIHQTGTTFFKIPHGISAGDLLFLLIKVIRSRTGELAEPYHLTFTEMGNATLQGERGARGQQGPKGDPGDPGGGGARVELFNSTITAIKQTQTILSGINDLALYKNIMFSITSPETPPTLYWNTQFFITDISELKEDTTRNWILLYFVAYLSFSGSHSYTYFIYKTNSQKLFISNPDTMTGDLEIKITGELK